MINQPPPSKFDNHFEKDTYVAPPIQDKNTNTSEEAISLQNQTNEVGVEVLNPANRNTENTTPPSLENHKFKETPISITNLKESIETSKTVTKRNLQNINIKKVACAILLGVAAVLLTVGIGAVCVFCPPIGAIILGVAIVGVACGAIGFGVDIATDHNLSSDQVKQLKDTAKNLNRATALFDTHKLQKPPDHTSFEEFLETRPAHINKDMGGRVYKIQDLGKYCDLFEKQQQVKEIDKEIKLLEKKEAKQNESPFEDEDHVAGQNDSTPVEVNVKEANANNLEEPNKKIQEKKPNKKELTEQRGKLTDEINGITDLLNKSIAAESASTKAAETVSPKVEEAAKVEEPVPTEVANQQSEKKISEKTVIGESNKLIVESKKLAELLQQAAKLKKNSNTENNQKLKEVNKQIETVVSPEYKTAILKHFQKIRANKPTSNKKVTLEEFYADKVIFSALEAIGEKKRITENLVYIDLHHKMMEAISENKPENEVIESFKPHFEELQKNRGVINFNTLQEEQIKKIEEQLAALPPSKPILKEIKSALQTIRNEMKPLESDLNVNFPTYFN